MFPFGGLSGTANRLKISIFIPDNPPTPLYSSSWFRFIPACRAKGHLSHGMPPPNSFPLPFLLRGYVL